MPPKKSVKETPIKEEDEDILLDESDKDEEEFFTKNSYISFMEKNGIEYLGNSFYTDNDLHKEDIIVPREYRITSEIMSLAEYTRVISERAKQIENGSPIFIDVKNIHDPILIAEKEIKQKKSPMIINRYLTRHIKEEWAVNEMNLPFI